MPSDAAPDDSPRLPRIAVVGTSNSVAAGGWARVVQQATERVAARNFSLGFCSSDLFAFRQAAMDPAEFDLCLVDFACNDGTLLASGAHDAARIEAALRHVVSTTTTAGCLPVLMILPVQSFRPEGRKIGPLYRAAAERFALPFFDGYAWLDRLEADPAMAGVPLFKDNMHLENPVSVQLGHLVAELLPGLAAARDLAGKQGAAPGFELRYFPAGAAIRRALPRVTRGTALLQLELVEVAAETGFDFQLPAGFEATGIVADFGHSQALVTLSGSRSTRLHVVSKHATGPEAKMVMGIWPLPVTVPELGGTLRITVGRGKAWDVTTDHGVKPLGPEETPRLALAGLVARRREPALPLKRLLASARDLVSEIPEARMQAARAALLKGAKAGG
ncbi:hypothetical protein [Roseomonas sp. 18066]|uniref:SGNH/GDSL hydrolase family protein n=1 Tax=Roseomonas sp. 18066 TaxID=2681412 RepID=UPI00135B1937|nr:hypothetical protein [Roseomonas sp. 18066]